MLQRLRSWIGRDEDELDYDELWLERLTHQGGWERQYRNVAFDEIPDRPESDDNEWLLGEGRYRLITRKDERYGEIIWEYETDGADDHYDEKREEEQRDQQREALEEMSLKEVEAEWEGETNRLDLVPEYEIRSQYFALMQEQQETQEQGEEPGDPMERIKTQFALKKLQSDAFVEEYGYDIALSMLTDSTSGPSGQAERDAHPFADLMAEMAENPDRFEEFVQATGTGLGTALRGFTEASSSTDAKFSMTGETENEE